MDTKDLEAVVRFDLSKVQALFDKAAHDLRTGRPNAALRALRAARSRVEVAIDTVERVSREGR